MDRRTFLLNSTSLFFTGLLGISRPSTIFGFSEVENKPIPRVAIIIDDIGFSRSQAKPFLNLNIPITFAILPKLYKTRDLAVEIHELGYEIMLHQPMEAHDRSLDPGPGAIFVGYGPEKIKEVVRENIAGVSYVSGVNNHMGSRLTEHRVEMNEVLDVVEDDSLFFVDSFTSSRSIAFREASRRQIPSACRNIFLDNFRNESSIINQLRLLFEEAINNGQAVGIGHPFPETARAISRFFAGQVRLSQCLVPISSVLRG